MKRIVASFWLACALLACGTLCAQVSITSGLRTPVEYQGVIFRWENAPDWLITDVVFGIKDGKLVFARYTATPPGGQPVVHDRMNEVDHVIEDTTKLPFPVEVEIGGRTVLVDHFTLGVLADGTAAIDTVQGRDLQDKRIAIDSVENAAGVCGAPTVLGTCNSSACFGGSGCKPDLPSADPCDCTGTGFCTAGTARFECPTGTCGGICRFDADLKLCGCFPAPPTCKVTTSSTGFSAVIQSSTVGLASISVTTQVNVNVNIPSFTSGTTAPVVVTGTKQNPNQRAQVALLAVDLNGNSTSCDPVILLVIRHQGKPVREIVEELPAQEGLITIHNGTPGLQQLAIRVNGFKFKMAGLKSGEERTLDVTSAMLPGSDNSIELTAHGKPGGSATVVIHD